MDKLDLTKKYKSYFSAKQKPEIIEVETAQFISYPGKGDPSGKDFSENIQALYTTAYVLKFMYKAQDKDFIVSKLEGLWWFDEKLNNHISMAEAPVKIPRSEWEYRLLIRLPDFVTEAAIQKAIAVATTEKGITNAGNIQFHQMQEGKCVQMLHVGPFSTEPETLQHLFEFCKASNLQRNGLHHEIYLSDFRKTAPEKLKTILREPVR